ncbi:MAG: VOC family protein [Acidobacteriota bacterium]|nr:VOC family protein [Acidobacteriota bacterium]
MRPVRQLFRAAPAACAVTLALLSAACSHVAPAPAPAAPVELDHVWIVVSPDAPERAALETAGFHISPEINRHVGQGTASLTVEFPNAFLELLWPDAAVSVAPGAERGVEKFRNRMNWRTTGWCPIGIGLRRTRPTNAPWPFATWSIAPGWLPPGASIEMLTPRDDSTSPSLFISARDASFPPAADANDLTLRKDPADPVFHHPIGVKRLSSVRLLAPAEYRPIPPLTYLQERGVIGSGAAERWLVELTFDGGARGESRDLRPELPLTIRY